MKLIMALFALIITMNTTIAATTVSDKLVDALIVVETNGDNTKVGKYGEIGILQIRECVIQDVNRIYKTNYVLKDALDNNKAKEICRKYLQYWGNHYQKKTGKTADSKVLSMIWNGGPNAWKKKDKVVVANLNRYWTKVQRELA